ncbi:UNVERIFIED_CONTAM: hypothetical protein PYX00_003559 [Menopon gallinae]|uniref:PDZ domain-containing protein 8 n=1 Tax=Menopon gallinae TaxID=328185 RepID=A0AAW2I2E7_9NEOP
MFLSWLTTVIGSIIIGVALTLFLQYYFYKKYFSTKECVVEENRIIHEPLFLPKIFANLISNTKISPGDTCMAVNLLLQFLFHELRDTEKVRKWFRRNLSWEFEQLLSSSAIGRMIANIKIREIHLGSEFPVLTNIGVQNIKTSENYSHIDTLDLKLDLSYTGNFRLVFDVSLLGKSAYVSVAVNELYGEGRLQFSRLPYSHWSFTFYNEPKLHLDVISQFRGRAYQQVTTLISNQIRRALRKKHTLPNYKMRYKPFFNVIPQERKVANIAAGQIQLIIHTISRLNEELANNREVYVLAGTDNLPWVEIRNYGNCNYFLLDVVIVKMSHNMGLYFKQNYIEEKDELCLVLDEINLVGFKTEEELQVGDVLVSVEGKRVNTVGQLNKLFKSMPSQFTLRVERKISNTKNSQPDTISNSGSSASISSVNCPINSGLRRRKGSESESCSSTPSTSLPGSPARRNYFRNPLEITKLTSTSQQEVPHLCDELCQKIIKTRCFPNNQVLTFDEVFNFNVKSCERFLNINVRAKENETQSDTLLGYVNIPLSYLETSDDYLKSLSWKPPDLLAVSSRNHKLACHNGFNPTLCYGDIVLTLQYVDISQPSLSSHSMGKVPEVVESDLTVSESTESLQETVEILDRKHDFVRTHFNGSIQCGFCGKKIWLKDAERCRECGMSIHKKCVAKCISESVCLSQSSQSSMTKITDDSTGSEATGVVSPITFNIEDTDSCSKMKTEINATNEDTTPHPSLPTELSDEISSVLETLMQKGSSHGDLMHVAKESGKNLYEELDIAERKEKINDMVNKLKGAIDAELEARCLLEKEQNEEDEEKKAKTAFLIGKNNEKTQTLMILMLHFCAGLQHIQDLEEQEREMDDSVQDSPPQLT